MTTHTITLSSLEVSIILDALLSHAETMRHCSPPQTLMARRYGDLASRISNDIKKANDPSIRPYILNNEKSWTVANVLLSLNSEEIEHICVVRKMKDGTWDSVCSKIDQATLALFMMTLTRRAYRAMEDNLDDDEG